MFEPGQFATSNQPQDFIHHNTMNPYENIPSPPTNDSRNLDSKTIIQALVFNALIFLTRIAVIIAGFAAISSFINAAMDRSLLNEAAFVRFSIVTFAAIKFHGYLKNLVK